MAKENNILEEAIIQMKNLEEAVAENAKGILASTMKQEIKDLVKESLYEADEDEDEEIEDEDEDMSDVDFGDEEEEEEEEEEELPNFEDDDLPNFEDDEEEVVDLRSLETSDMTPEEKSDVLLTVFKAMKDTDKIQVEKDPEGKIHLSDKEADTEYIIVTESDDDLYEDYMSMDEEYMDEDYMQMEEDAMYEDYMPVDEDDMYEGDMYESNMYEDEDKRYEEILSKFDDPETIYEVEMDEEMYEGMDEEMYEGMDEEMYEGMDKEMYEEDDYVMESKKSFKSKGMGMGSPSKFSYSKKPNMEGGFDEDMKEGPKRHTKGSPKYSFDSNSPSLKGAFSVKPKTSKKEKSGGMMTKPKRGEFKEASRTLGSGSNFRKGGLPKPKAHSAFNANIEESFDNRELGILREKNEEYRKALNVFRNKLNEVAVFNSNLAYATRLFTEHSTSKQEKINILKRFDEVENLKESKTLYKIIKDELTTSKPQQVNESIERTINKVPTTGSAINLIESKTYENPQFLRMKDLMSKLK